MRFTWRTVALIGWSVVFVRPWAAQGYIDGPKDPPATRFALADCVVLGKITALQAKPVEAGVYGGPSRKKTFRLATFEIKEAISGGVKDTKQIQVGFLEYEPKVGEEGCLCAIKHPDRDFYVVPGPGTYFLKKDHPDYQKELALLRRCAKLLEDPNASLKSRDARERWLTAFLLCYRYNWAPLRKPVPGTKMKEEPLEAEQSKLLLLFFADAEWTRRDAETNSSPADMLQLIRLSRTRQNLPTPAAFPKFGEALGATAEADARKWLREHAETYRLARLHRAK